MIPTIPKLLALKRHQCNNSGLLGAARDAVGPEGLGNVGRGLVCCCTFAFCGGVVAVDGFGRDLLDLLGRYLGV